MTGELHRLPNGIPVLMDPMPESGVVVAGLFFTIGSRVETPETSGYAHMVEHDVFRGTKRRTWRQISNDYADLGIGYDAATGTDMTKFIIETLPEDFSAGFDVLCDMIRNPTFPADAIQTEHAVILEEIKENQDDFGALAGERAVAAAYPDQPYSAPILGTVQTVSDATPDSLRAFMAQYYHTGNLVIGVSGAFDPDTMLRDIESRMNGFPEGPRTVLAPPVFQPTCLISHQKVQQTQLDAIFNAHARPETPLYLMTDILGDGPSSRLFREVREERGLAYSIDADADISAGAGMLSISAETATAKVKEVLDVIAHEVRHFAIHGATDAELNRAKKATSVRIAKGRSSPQTRMRILVDNFIESGCLRTIDDVLRDTKNTTLRDINEVARDVLSGQPALSLVGDRPSKQSYKRFLQGLRG